MDIKSAQPQSDNDLQALAEALNDLGKDLETGQVLLAVDTPRGSLKAESYLALISAARRLSDTLTEIEAVLLYHYHRSQEENP